jgi:hypothetical protein
MPALNKDRILWAFNFTSRCPALKLTKTDTWHHKKSARVCPQFGCVFLVFFKRRRWIWLFVGSFFGLSNETREAPTPESPQTVAFIGLASG